jgi:hypothetical protein
MRLLAEADQKHKKAGSSDAAGGASGIGLKTALTFLICAAMLAAYAGIAHSAAGREAATFDEPMHLVSSYLVAHWSDYRCDPENPALFKRWVALGLPADSLHPDKASPLWQMMWEYHDNQLPFTERTLYQDSAIDPPEVIARARAVMVAAAVLLGSVIGWWAFRLGGSAAALVATAAFCFDPNFLAHGPLVKNDVIAALAMTALIYRVWRTGQNASPLRCLILLAALAASLTVKFSGVLVFGIASLLLLGRAMMPGAWFVFGSRYGSRFARLVAAAGLIAALAIGSWVAIWALYGFRFGPAPDSNVQLDFQPIVRETSQNEYIASHLDAPPLTDAQRQSLPVSLPSRLMLAANETHLLPAAFLAGQYYTYDLSLVRAAYFCGHLSMVGWWYYFPLAILFKTPLALLTAGVLSAVVAIGWGRRWFEEKPRGWTALCLLGAPSLYLLIAMQSHVNAGIRHILPVYAFADIAIGVCAAAALRRWGAPAAITLGVLGVGLLIETLTAYPHYIAFFNAAAGGSRGGLYLLGDSNLDWGQDLPMLADWEKAHPDEPVYFDYSGTAVFRIYGVRALNLRDNDADFWHLPPTGDSGVLAISATILQGIGRTPVERAQFAPLWRQTPLAVLGGTIYLYRWPIQQISTSPAMQR